MMKLQWGQNRLQENDMSIANSFYQSQNLFSSEFFCPNCRALRPYDHKRMPEDMIECRFCKTSFDADMPMRCIQSLYKLAGTTKYELDKGMSPGFLKLQLISEGLNENFAEQLIRLALQ